MITSVWSTCRLSLTYAHLCGQGKRVGKKEFSEQAQLFDLGGWQLFIVVRAIVAVQTNQMRPFLQVRGEFASGLKSVNARYERLASKRRIELTRCQIQRLPKHRCRSIAIPAQGVVSTLEKRAAHAIRDSSRTAGHVGFRIHLHHIAATGRKGIRKITNPFHPLHITGACNNYAQNSVAAAAGKHDRPFFLSDAATRNRAHGHPLGQAVWAGGHQIGHKFFSSYCPIITFGLWEVE